MFNVTLLDSLFMLKVTTDTLTRADIDVIHRQIEQTLTPDIKTIVIAVTVGTLVNHNLMSSLLCNCRVLAGRFNVNLMMMEKNGDRNGLFKALCHNLQIPLYSAQAREQPPKVIGKKENNQPSEEQLADA